MISFSFPKGTLIGFKGDLIHVFNKDENAFHKSDYFKKLHHRKNVILLGDSLGDVRMAEGCAADCNVLKIGFLNDKVSQGFFSKYRVDANGYGTLICRSH